MGFGLLYRMASLAENTTRYTRLALRLPPLDCLLSSFDEGGLLVSLMLQLLSVQYRYVRSRGHNYGR
jgi:hypothetical protein